MIINTTAVVPEEEWVKVFRLIKDEIVGKDSFIKIEFGELEDDDERDRNGEGLPSNTGDSVMF